jgi:hypothetical protein
MDVDQELSRRIQAAIDRLTPEAIGHVNFDGIKYKALPLLGTVGEIWLLRPDGSLWRADSDFGLPLEPLPEELHTTAIVAGTRTYPWLAKLLPPRPAAAATCPNCGGSGKVGPEDAFFCHSCGALGWVLPGEQSNK